MIKNYRNALVIATLMALSVDAAFAMEGEDQRTIEHFRTQPESAAMYPALIDCAIKDGFAKILTPAYLKDIFSAGVAGSNFLTCVVNRSNDENKISIVAMVGTNFSALAQNTIQSNAAIGFLKDMHAYPQLSLELQIAAIENFDLLMNDSDGRNFIKAFAASDAEFAKDIMRRPVAQVVAFFKHDDRDVSVKEYYVELISTLLKNDPFLSSELINAFVGDQMHRLIKNNYGQKIFAALLTADDSCRKYLSGLDDATMHAMLATADETTLRLLLKAELGCSFLMTEIATSADNLAKIIDFETWSTLFTTTKEERLFLKALVDAVSTDVAEAFAGGCRVYHFLYILDDGRNVGIEFLRSLCERSEVKNKLRLMVSNTYSWNYTLTAKAAEGRSFIEFLSAQED